MYFKFYEYDSTNDKFEHVESIKYDEVLEYTYIENDHPEYNQLNITVKNIPKLERFAPTSIEQANTQKALIITNENGNGVKFYAFIINRDLETIGNNEKLLKFQGVGFTYFEKGKLIRANSNHNNTAPENLPDGFACYRANTTAQTHLEYFYNTFLNPQELTYGVLANVPAPYRKFTALEDVTVSSAVTGNFNMSLEQTTVLDSKDVLFQMVGFDFVTRCLFNPKTGKLSLSIEEPYVVPNDITIGRYTIEEQLFSVQSTENMCFAKGNPNNVYTYYSKFNSDFTTFEFKEDFEFIAGVSNTYLIAPAKTSVADKQRSRFSNFIKVKINNASGVRVGLIANLKGVYYRIVQIEEKGSTSGIEFSVELKEVTLLERWK